MADGKAGRDMKPGRGGDSEMHSVSSFRSARVSPDRSQGSDIARPSPVGPRRSQDERRQESEVRLLEAARILMSRKGWVGMTLAQVGEAAGYSRGQAASHFGSKGALLRALTLHINRSFVDEMQQAAPSAAGLQSVLNYVRIYLGRSDPKWTNTRTLLLLLAEALLEDSDTAEVVAEYNREMFAWLEDNLRQGIAKGEVRADVDPALGAEFVVGAMRGFALQRLLKGQVANIQEIKEPAIQLIRNMFAVPDSQGQG